MPEKLRGQPTQPELGLLPHEARFVLHALARAQKRQAHANSEYGKAADNTGGDWALDDPTTRVAAEEGALSDAQVALYEELRDLGKDVDAVPYPGSEQVEAAYGSRVTLDYSGGQDEEYDVFDIATRLIPGIPKAGGVSIVSTQTPFGGALIGAKPGETVSYTMPNGRQAHPVVISIDQTAQQLFYDEAVPAQLPEGSQPTSN